MIYYFCLTVKGPYQKSELTSCIGHFENEIFGFSRNFRLPCLTVYLTIILFLTPSFGLEEAMKARGVTVFVASTERDSAAIVLVFKAGACRY